MRTINRLPQEMRIYPPKKMRLQLGVEFENTELPVEPDYWNHFIEDGKKMIYWKRLRN